jgi:hypothetical protein
VEIIDDLLKEAARLFRDLGNATGDAVIGSVNVADVPSSTTTNRARLFAKATA